MKTPTTQEMLEPARTALALYGATLDAEGYIQKGDRATDLRIVQKRGRYRVESREGDLYASGAADGGFVSRFVEAFWYWKRAEVAT